MNDCPKRGNPRPTARPAARPPRRELRAAIVAHVDACVDCREELELLRGVREMLAANAASVSRVDVSWVVAALPKPPMRERARVARLSSAGVARPGRVWSDWRVAAAVTMLVVGGSSVAVLNRGHGIDAMLPDTVQLPPPPTAETTGGAAPNTNTAMATTGAPTASRVAARSATASEDDATEPMLGAGGRLENLNEQQLKRLLNDIGQMQAVPVTDPEPVTLHVDGKNSSAPEENRL